MVEEEPNVTDIITNLDKEVFRQQYLECDAWDQAESLIAKAGYNLTDTVCADSIHISDIPADMPTLVKEKLTSFCFTWDDCTPPTKRCQLNRDELVERAHDDLIQSWFVPSQLQDD